MNTEEDEAIESAYILAKGACDAASDAFRYYSSSTDGNAYSDALRTYEAASVKLVVARIAYAASRRAHEKRRTELNTEEDKAMKSAHQAASAAYYAASKSALDAYDAAIALAYEAYDAATEAYVPAYKKGVKK